MLVKQAKPKPADMKYKYCVLSVRAALITIAQKFQSPYKSFTWSGECWTVSSALAELDDFLLDMPCGSFGVVGFTGGPPRQCSPQQGTMLTMLCDEALFWHYTRKLEFEELLGI
ncbi:MAG: hypothetical protein AMS22_06265 [Thiotrichales bacterium SG8_50]|nr:MAG: hypothetical protein AMS22_06265 [Thiotrichales bacterium SG8_50]